GPWIRRHACVGREDPTRALALLLSGLPRAGPSLSGIRKDSGALADTWDPVRWPRAVPFPHYGDPIRSYSELPLGQFAPQPAADRFPELSAPRILLLGKHPLD